MDGGNGTALERAGHALKGSALGVGAWRLSVLAQCAEAHGREGRPERARSLVVELETELAAVETHLPGSF